MSNLKIAKESNKFRLSGKIDEHSDLSEIFNNQFSAIYLDMAEVESLNSSGVRIWVSTISKFPGEIFYHNCSVAVTEQFSMVPEIIGSNSKINSFYALFFCSECEQEKNISLHSGPTLTVRNKLS